MTEGLPGGQELINLSSLVKEAFIDPIRSVLIIDDEYPTWDHVFSDGFNAAEKGRWKERSDIVALIGQFRRKSHALTIDIHDGEHNGDIGTYLHQSDLLVLDYQLEKSGMAGAKAIAIMKSLFENRHFNLIVMHTATEPLHTPFETVLDSLLRPCPEVSEFAERGKALIADAEDDAETETDDDHLLKGIWGKLRETVGRDVHFLYRQEGQKGKLAAGFVRTQPKLEKFRNLCVEAGWNIEQQIEIFCRIIQVYEEGFANTVDRPLDIRWSAPGQSSRPWIRAPGGFIAFAGKKDPELLLALAEAIEDWKPSPSRLISSKIRAAMSAEGAYAEESALSDKHIYWQYYEELSKSPDGDEGRSHRKSLLEAHAARHTERLLDVVGGKAIAFGLKLIECDPGVKDKSTDGFGSHYNLNMKSQGAKRDAVYRYNSHISTKPVSGWHLHPGHIFKLEDTLWVCVSPACDLVPNQKGQAAINESASARIKPFMAVQLHPRAKDLGKDDINSNTFLFLKKEDGSVGAFSVSADGGKNAPPVWRLFNADNFGIFVTNSETKTTSLMLHYLCGESGKLSLKACDVEISAQLRYEYALNLIQKLGVEMTRVGLDYLSPA